MRQEDLLSAPFNARRMPLRAAAACVPPGRWGVAVSGGADSVATLRLMSSRASTADVALVVIHLDHELRGPESQADAHFVEQLALELKSPIHLRRRLELARLRPDLAEMARAVGTGLPQRMRELRLEVFREAIQEHRLQGMILGHHADDVAETILLRLLRSSSRSGTLGLAPLRMQQVVAGVRLLRPMLCVRRRRLRQFLVRTGCQWREDASNATASQFRNRLRMLLAGRPEVSTALLQLASSTAAAEAELDAVTSPLDSSPSLQELVAIPRPLVRRALRRWIVERGVPDESAGPRAVDGLMAMLDAAGPPALDLAGGVRVRRHRGRLIVS